MIGMGSQVKGHPSILALLSAARNPTIGNTGLSAILEEMN